MRWTLGLILGFGLMLAVNGYFLYLAVHTDLQIDPSYETEAR